MRRTSILWLLLSVSAWAQFTTVSGTVTDPNGFPYAGGTISPVLVISSSPKFTASNQPYTPPSQPVGLSSAGSFVMQLADVTALTPGAGTYSFTVSCGSGCVPVAGGKGPVSFTITGITISGASQSITAQLTAAALLLSSSASSNLIQNATFNSLNGTLTKDTNAAQNLTFWTGTQGTTNPPQYVSLWLGANTTNPSSPNITFFCDMTDAGISFADCVVNSQGGNVTLRDRNVTSLDCGERIGVQATPGCLVPNTLKADVYISQGTTFGVSGCSATTPAGGGSAGKFNSGVTGTCTVTITPVANGTGPANGWACGQPTDLTTNADTSSWHQTASTTTTVTLSGTAVTGDVINFSCTGY